jgi:MtN3 and saliva related transmembrane protein
MATDFIGWFSSLILVATVAQQVHKQWKEDNSDGVSRWLFLGQISASVGFTVYSMLVKNWVFVATNALMFCNALIGCFIVLRHRRRKARRELQHAERNALVSNVQTAACARLD